MDSNETGKQGHLDMIIEDDIWVRGINGRRDMGAGDSIQDCLDEHGEGTKIRVTDRYDPSVESLPVEVNDIGVVIEGNAGGSGVDATINNPTGQDFFHLNTDNKRNPGVAIRDLKIVQTGGGSGIRCSNSKFNLFDNVDVDANNIGGDDAFHFGEAADIFGNNTQIFIACSAEQAGRDGFQFGGLAHHIAMFGCTALGCGRMGVYANGPYSIKFIGGQLEDCREPGFRARQADVVLVGGNTYIEGNARRGSIGNCEIDIVNTPNAVVDQAWCNAEPNGTHAAVSFQNSPSGEVRNLQTDAGYDCLVRTDSEDTELNRSSHRIPPAVAMADIRPDACRVRDRGTIIGAGVNNGGHNNISGVNLAEVPGVHPHEEATSDGSTIPRGIPARWLGADKAWQPSDGSDLISPSAN